MIDVKRYAFIIFFRTEAHRTKIFLIEIQLFIVCYFNVMEFNNIIRCFDFIINVIDKAVKAIQKNTLMKVSYRKVKNGRSIEYIVFKLNDWGEPSAEWKEKMKRIEAIIHRTYDEDL